jgi:ferredoxin
MHDDPEAKASVIFPCLGGMPAAYLIAPLAWGAETVQMKRGDCNSCPLGSAMSQFDQTLRQARQLLSRYGIPAERLQEVSAFGGHRLSEDQLGRREFFAFFQKRAVEKTLSLIPEPVGDPNQTRWARQENPLRAFLLELLRGLGNVRNGVLSSSEFPVVGLEVSDACVGCNVCETLCPTSAIRRDSRDDQEIRLLFTVSRCVGCRICGQACRAKAISFSETIELEELVRGEERELIRDFAKSCSVCGEPILGLPGDTCTECRGFLRTRLA